ncbi:hypothetical protein D9M73_187620 [compost metagenome]
MFGRIGCLRQRKETKLFHQLDGLELILLRSTGWNGAQQPVAVHRFKLDRKISGGYRRLITGWNEQVLAAFSLVIASRANVRDGDFPRIDQRAEQPRTDSGWNIQHDRPVLEVEIKVNIVSRGVRRGELQPPVRGPGPIQDVVVLSLGIPEKGFSHGVDTDDRHAPDCRLDSASLEGATGQLLRAEIFGHNRGWKCGKCRDCQQDDVREFRFHSSLSRGHSAS